MNKPRLLAVVGPTASGKSDLALELADRLNGEIVSADSMQIYRGMDIGTAKPSKAERERIPHHMIDIVDPDCSYSAGRFQREALGAIASVHSRGKLPILVGGSGLYVSSITYRLDFSARPAADPELRRSLDALSAGQLYDRLQQADAGAAARIHPHNLVRVRRALEIALSGGSGSYDFGRERDDFDVTIIGVDWPRQKLYERINWRVDDMLKRGLYDEVKSLYDCFGADTNAMQAIGYKEIVSLLQGRTNTLAEAVDQIRLNTRHFAKRQITWFRRDRRITWLPGEADTVDSALHRIERTL